MPRRPLRSPRLLISTRDARFFARLRACFEQPLTSALGAAESVRLERVVSHLPVPPTESAVGVVADLDGTSGLARLREIRDLAQRLPPLPWLLVAPPHGPTLTHLDWALPEAWHRGRLLVLKPASQAALRSAAASLLELHRAEPEELCAVGAPPPVPASAPRSLRAEVEHLEAYLRGLPERLAPAPPARPAAEDAGGGPPAPSSEW